MGTPKVRQRPDSLIYHYTSLIVNQSYCRSATTYYSTAYLRQRNLPTAPYTTTNCFISLQTPQHTHLTFQALTYPFSSLPPTIFPWFGPTLSSHLYSYTSPSTTTANHPPLPQRLPVVRPRPPPVILPAQTTLTDTIPPTPIDHTSVTLLKSSTPGPEPPITSLTCSTPRPSRLSRRRNPTQGQLCPLTSPLMLTSSPPSLTEETTLTVVKQNNTNQNAKKQPNLLTFIAEIHPCSLLTSPRPDTKLTTALGYRQHSPSSKTPVDWSD